MSASESYVQVAADGSGKKIRNLKVSTYVDVNGVPTLTDVYIQVASIADENGVPIDFDEGTQVQLFLPRDTREPPPFNATIIDPGVRAAGSGAR